ncbi:MAG: UDP-2,3-diacylglucosamine diphosphatase [Synergistaceae bacterium]|nr:UDP-2,3-diacylglucosamine diphosphatase [Synergistota bacterium]NLM71424.1 UDP-2,3-diacylglucosamine diphosphatase [Synergistaceae bacterium]
MTSAASPMKKHDFGKGASRLRYRSVFLSDIHLGTRWCKTGSLASFLRSLECERLYLIGDIFDGWTGRGATGRPASHNSVIRRVLKLSRTIPVTYITGNHDSFMREYHGSFFGGVEICENAVHSSPGGKRYLVVHGHEFDAAMIRKTWLAYLGAKAYDLTCHVNAGLSLLRSFFGLGRSSFSARVKHTVKGLAKLLGNYEEKVAKTARAFGVDGVICGHIHTPSIRRFKGIDYFNCGDWIDHCSALVEHFDGAMEIIRCLDRFACTGRTKEISLNREHDAGFFVTW